MPHLQFLSKIIYLILFFFKFTTKSWCLVPVSGRTSTPLQIRAWGHKLHPSSRQSSAKPALMMAAMEPLSMAPLPFSWPFPLSWPRCWLGRWLRVLCRFFSAATRQYDRLTHPGCSVLKMNGGRKGHMTNWKRVYLQEKSWIAENNRISTNAPEIALQKETTRKKFDTILGKFVLNGKLRPFLF